MAVTYVTSDAVGGGGVVGDTLTFTAVNGGAGDFLLVIPARRVITFGDTIASVTYGGTPVTQLFQFNPFVENSASAIGAFYLPAPPGTENVVVTYLESTNQRVATAYVLSGVNQSDPLGVPLLSYEPNSVLSRLESVTSAEGELVIDALGLINNPTATESEDNQTQRHSLTSTTSCRLTTSTKPGETATAMGYTLSSSSSRSSYVLIPVHAASGQQSSVGHIAAYQAAVISAALAGAR